MARAADSLSIDIDVDPFIVSLTGIQTRPLRVFYHLILIGLFKTPVFKELSQCLGCIAHPKADETILRTGAKASSTWSPASNVASFAQPKPGHHLSLIDATSLIEYSFCLLYKIVTVRALLHTSQPQDWVIKAATVTAITISSSRPTASTDLRQHQAVAVAFEALAIQLKPPKGAIRQTLAVLLHRYTLVTVAAVWTGASVQAFSIARAAYIFFIAVCVRGTLSQTR
jgi:hypothetical protein